MTRTTRTFGPSSATRIEAGVSELLAEYRIPSASIGVLQDGMVTDLAVGLKNISTRQPATTDTTYGIGSMTKAWTALAFMQLVDEGKVDLDEPVRNHLSGFMVADPTVSAELTPRHLLNHTNGIEEAFGDPGERDDVYQRMVENIRKAPQIHPLGYTHSYSAALGYAILARIIEVVDDAPWDTIMAERLFLPLGLTRTSSRREQVDPSRAATPYITRSPEEGPIPSPVVFLRRSYGPGGNITSTPREVLAMAHVVLSGGELLGGRRILSADAIHEMTTSRFPVPDPYLLGSEWALGLTVFHWNGETVYGHDGGLVGQHSRLRIFPDSNLAIAMLANGGSRDSFYRKVFNAILTELGAVTIPELPQPDPTLRLQPSGYVGVYQRLGVRYEVSAEDGRLLLTHVLDPFRAQVLGKPDRITYELFPIDETHFLVQSDDPLEDAQTVAIYDFKEGVARYLHINARGIPRVGLQP